MARTSPGTWRRGTRRTRSASTHGWNRVRRRRRHHEVPNAPDSAAPGLGAEPIQAGGRRRGRRNRAARRDAARPAGRRYRIQVTLEESKTRGAAKTVSFAEDDHAACDIELATDNRKIAIDLAACDSAIRRVLDVSSSDGQDAVAWLKGDWRPTRKACLLNVLATLRIRPTVSTPLVHHVQHFFWISNDRVYGKVDRQLPVMLESLALDPKKPFYREGRPKSDVHLKLLDAIPESPEVKRLFTPEGLRSLPRRGPPLASSGRGRASGRSHTYAEFDLDLGNPLHDVVGFVVHMGELLYSTITNHLDLRKTLAKSMAGQCLYYSIATSAATFSQSRTRRRS